MEERNLNKRFVWFNNEIIPEQEAKLSIYDSALMFGDMVFEMTRSFNKIQFKLREHLERLYASMKFVHIDCGISICDMEKFCYQIIKVNDPFFEKDDEHRLMINVSRGLLSIYQDIADAKSGVNVIISDFPLCWTTRGMGKLYDEGINAVITSQRAIPAYLLDPKIKSRSRLHYQMANIEASKQMGKNNWALLLDPDGFVAEGTGDNFFIVKDNVVSTPEGRNILRGISRSYVFELANQLKIPYVESNIEPYDVYNADEAFMTGTPFCILPVFRLNNTLIGGNKMGKVTEKLIKTWGENVGVDIVQQIKNWGGEMLENSPYKFG